MGEELSDKINSLSESDSNLLYENLYSILNDRLCSLLYGGITSKEYPDPPADKIKKIKERLYLEMSSKQ